MKFNIKSDLIHDISADIIILAVDDKNQIIQRPKIPAATLSLLSKIVNGDDLKQEVGSVTVVHGDITFKPGYVS